MLTPEWCFSRVHIEPVRFHRWVRKGVLATCLTSDALQVMMLSSEPWGELHWVMLVWWERRLWLSLWWPWETINQRGDGGAALLLGLRSLCSLCIMWWRGSVGLVKARAWLSLARISAAYMCLWWWVRSSRMLLRWSLWWYLYSTNIIGRYLSPHTMLCV